LIKIEKENIRRLAEIVEVRNTILPLLLKINL
jgi:hypothetical protein